MLLVLSPKREPSADVKMSLSDHYYQASPQTETTNHQQEDHYEQPMTIWFKKLMTHHAKFPLVRIPLGGGVPSNTLKSSIFERIDSSTTSPLARCGAHLLLGISSGRLQCQVRKSPAQSGAAIRWSNTKPSKTKEVPHSSAKVSVVVILTF